MLYSKVLADKLLAADEADTSLSPLAPVKTFPSYNDFPVSGSVLGTKALAIDTNILYIWLGAANSFGWYPLQYKTGLPELPWEPFSLLHTLDNPNAYGTSASDQFGYSVGFDGDYVIVGANYEDDAAGLNSGKAYIFNSNTGSLLHILDNPNAYGTSADDNFGYAVAISGNYAIVGAPNEQTGSGKAYIFDVTTGSLVHTLNNPNQYDVGEQDNFGVSVAISGNYAIVGSYYESSFDGWAGSGSVYVFDVTTGTLSATIHNPNAYGTPSLDFFGLQVATDGNNIIVGAYNEDTAAATNVGKVYTFSMAGGTGSVFSNPDPVQNDRYGSAVAIRGNYALVGCSQKNSADGAAYLYNLSTSQLIYTFTNPNLDGVSASDRFGAQVALSNDYAIVTATSENNNSGIVYVFKLSDGSLQHTFENPNAYGTNLSDFFGYKLSASTNRFVVSAIQEDDAGGQASGKAYIFSLD